MHYLDEGHIFVFLLQVFLLLGLARALGHLFTRFKLPALTAEILVGVLLGPTIFGRVAPKAFGAIFPNDIIQQNMLETVAWLGVLFLLLEMGLEMDLMSAWRQKGDAVKIAMSDIFVPMVIAFIPALLIPDKYLVDPAHRIVFALYIAAAMTISDMPVAARTLHDLRLSKTELGFLILSALSVNDIVGWLVFAIVLSVSIRPEVGIFSNLLIMASTLAFTAICLSFGRIGASAVIKQIKKKNMPEPASSLTFICLLGLACGAITSKIGIHALFGFFIAGITAGQSPALSQRTRLIISQMVHALFVPLFFANIGLKIDFLAGFNWLLVILFTLIGITGKFIGAWLGVMLTKISKANRLSISIAHTPGGAMVIVVGILALEFHVINEQVFIAIVCSAVFSSLLIGPWMAYSINRRPQISMLEFFSRSAIIPFLKAKTRDHAIEELSELAAEHENISATQQLKQAVLDREREKGTAMEEGIVVPHARTGLIKKPLVTIGRSSGGIDWDSPDGKEAEFIFLILTPQSDDDAQVQILGNIARVMTQPSTRQQLRQAQDVAAIWNIIHVAFGEHVVKKKV
jgi:fructose-specific phosphotransferase system IIA component